MPAASQLERTKTARHSGVVRLTHWLTFLAFIALLVTGGEIVISHPRFYWGEVGNVNTRPWLVIPIPSSRATVPTGYNFVMPDQNGWSRALHFEAAWVAVLTGLVYLLNGMVSGHFKKNLFPEARGGIWRACRAQIKKYLRRGRPEPADESSYNVLQRITYLAVIFVLFPLIIWTGLAMSPSFTSAFPETAALLGGRQSARTIHFLDSGLLLLFLLVHVVMVVISGFRSRMRAMITGYGRDPEEER
ncbi:MAG TPA: cytochrome b/b6 domain-containing protein [Terracidiphilus sp.]